VKRLSQTGQVKCHSQTRLNDSKALLLAELTLGESARANPPIADVANQEIREIYPSLFLPNKGIKTLQSYHIIV
jgi:hypothetical protein